MGRISRIMKVGSAYHKYFQKDLPSDERLASAGSAQEEARHHRYCWKGMSVSGGTPTCLASGLPTYSATIS